MQRARRIPAAVGSRGSLAAQRLAATTVEGRWRHAGDGQRHERAAARQLLSAAGVPEDAIDIQDGGGASQGAATVTRAPAARAATLAALDTVVQGDLANSHFGAMPIEPPPSAQSPPSSSPAPIHRGA